MNDQPTLTPEQADAKDGTFPPATLVQPDPNAVPSVGIIKVLLRRWAFIFLRAALVGAIGWLARHNLGFVANLLGENVDALVTGICGVVIVGCHELDLFVAVHPEVLPSKIKAVWDYFHPALAKPAGETK